MNTNCTVGIFRAIAASLFSLLIGSFHVHAEGWTGDKLSPPASSHRISQHSPKMASGDLTVILAKGGPSGLFVWAHLHGRHKGRTGKSSYVARVAVRDESGYYYFLSPVKEMSIGARLDAPDNNKHSYATFRVTGDAVEALKLGRTLKVEGIVERDYVDVGEQASELIKKCFSKLKPDELLKQLNKKISKPF